MPHENGMSTIDSNANSSPVVIRELQTSKDYLACVDLQEATWGIGFAEKVPPAILKIAQKIGGIAAGAFDAQGGLVGFVFGLTGLQDGENVHWSHLLATRNEWRDHGIGQQLKYYQRRQVLARGVRTMYWTFDPLVARNAHLNVNKLGVVVVEYARDMYVDDPASPVQAGIGMDRFIVKWDLAEDVAPGASSRPASGPPPHAPVINVAPRSGLPAPVSGMASGAGAVQVQIPGDIQEIQSSDLGLAARWRESTRSAFEHYLSSGYRVATFHTDSGSGDGFYMLEPPSGAE